MCRIEVEGPLVLQVSEAVEELCERARILCRIRPYRGRKVVVRRCSDGERLATYQDARSCQGGAKGLYR